MFENYILNQKLPLLVSEIKHQRELSNNVICADSKGSDQSAHMRSLIRAFVGRLNIS